MSKQLIHRLSVPVALDCIATLIMLAALVLIGYRESLG